MMKIEKYPFEMIIHSATITRLDSVVKPLNQWPDSYFNRLKELVDDEFYRRQKEVQHG